MSNSFFEAFEKGHVFVQEETPEIRLYYDEEGKIIATKYVQKNVKEDSKYIVISQEKYDAPADYLKSGPANSFFFLPAPGSS